MTQALRSTRLIHCRQDASMVYDTEDYVHVQKKKHFTYIHTEYKRYIFKSHAEYLFNQGFGFGVYEEKT